MSWCRKGAMWMLAAAVLWTAMPVSLCLLLAQPARQPACCRAMAKECGSMPGMAGSACCQVNRQDASLTPVLPYTPAHTERVALLPHADLALATTHPGPARGSLFETSPPLISPSGSSLLRI